MRDHIRLLGILNLIWSSASIALALVVLLVFGGLAAFFGVLGIESPNNNADGLLAAPFMALIGVAAVLLICLVSLPAFLGGIGLLKMKSWSRVLMIVISILHLFTFPVGTALGVYGLWVLFNEEARRLLEPSSPAAPGSPVVPA
jgi:hypothetical protein